MKKPEDEIIRALIIQEYRTKPLHLVRRYMKEELNIDASIRSVRTWLKEWGARKSDQATTAPSHHHHPRNARNLVRQAASPYSSPMSDPNLVLQPSFVDECGAWAASSQPAQSIQPASPTSSRISRRPTGLRIQTSGLDDLSPKSPITVQSLPQNAAREDFDQLLGFADTDQESVDMISPAQYLHQPHMDNGLGPAQMSGGPSHCPSLLSPSSCNNSSSNFSSAPNSFSVLSPSPMAMSYPDDLWSRAAQSSRHYSNGENEAPQYLSPNVAANRNGLGMRHGPAAPAAHIISSAASSPYPVEEVKASHVGDRSTQSQTPMQTYICPLVGAAYSLPTNPQFLHHPMGGCLFCGTGHGHHHIPAAPYGQGNQGHAPGGNVASMSYFPTF